MFFVTKVAYVFPNVGELRKKILIKSRNSRYSLHLDATKMYYDLREVFWWNGMKRDFTEFVAKCHNCQQVKVEHQRLRGLSQIFLFLLGSGKM